MATGPVVGRSRLALLGWAALSGTLLMASAPCDAADEDPGREQFVRSCGACHTADRGGAHFNGPNLFGVFGRRAGTAEGFGYSATLAKADWTWNKHTLDRWLADSRKGHPMAEMAYRQPDPEKRALVIRYLEKMR
jgi:cytochrome c